MRWLDKIRLRVRSLFQKPAVDRELEEELRFHLERQIQGNIAAGMSPDEAFRAARIEFGAAPRFQEECREARGLTFLQDVARDARIALRTLRKNPGFAAVTILTLALVIGANSAIFSAIYTLVFRRLPYKDPNQLVAIWDSNRHTGVDHIPVMEGSYPILHDGAKSFSGMAAFVGGIGQADMFQARIWGTEERVTEIGCTSELFPLLGVSPFIGHSFDPRGDVNNDLNAYPPPRGSAILSYSFWQRHYGASPDAIGKTLSINDLGVRYDSTIVGVMPGSFEFPYPLHPTKPDIWFQRGVKNSGFSPGQVLQVVARLQPRASLGTAQAELDTIADSIRRDHAKYYEAEYVTAVPLRSELTRDARPILWALLTALSFVLLIGCANIGNLMLMRAVSREKEMAVRVALGAGKLALIRQMLTETMLLSLGGGALGFLLAHWCLRVIVARIPASIYIPRANSMALESGVLACCVGASVIAAALFSLVPSLRLARSDLNRVINAATAAPDRPAISIFRRPGSLLLISEVSLAIVLLTGTVLLAKSLKRLIDVNLHFQPERLLVMDWSFSNPFILAHDSDSVYAAASSQLEQEVEGMPGVKSVAFADGFPFGSYTSTQQFKADGGGGPIAQNYQPAESHVVSPGFFEMMGMSLERGRWLADSDGPKALPVAVINQAMADRYWPGVEPLGQRVQPYYRFTDKHISYVIVGIIHEPQRFGSGGVPRPAVYLSSEQAILPFASILVRTSADPRSLADPLRTAALKLAPGQMFVSRVHTGDDLISESSARSRITVILLASFAGLALVLGMTGIYGLISYYTAQRTREIGIRMALGATPLKVFRLVLKEGMSLVSIGLALGLIFGYGFGKGLANLLYATSPGDFVSFAVAAAVFGVVAFAACYIPARRATRVDPMAALRAE
ncbi:MAG TPA: ABC transporter permease [Candidatus Acidoferrales bacterium]|nr:ABC transporter permease [Candidatus Acidoferrales bacterium]